MDVLLNTALAYLQEHAAAYPKVFLILGYLYLVGFGFKLLRSAVEAMIKESPSQADDLKLKEFEDSRLGKILFFVMDLLFRIKKPEVKKS